MGLFQCHFHRWKCVPNSLVHCACYSNCHRCTLLLCHQRKIQVNRIDYRNRKLWAIKLSFVSLRLLTSRKCLHWASVASQRCWWAKRRLLTKHKRNWAPNRLTWTLLKNPAITQSTKYCWHSATSISDVSLANLPRVCNWKPQRERDTVLEEKLFLMSQH